MIEFNGIYAPLIRQYIDFKRNLGYKFKVEYEFAVFDRFTIENNEKVLGFTRKLIEKWGEKRVNESDVTRYRRIKTVRCFSIYLNQLGYSSYIPRQLKKYKSTFTPYVFSLEEIRRFFLACDAVEITPFSRASHILPAIFRLIYGCGLRVSEALSLRCGDVFFDEKYIIIRNTKNELDRMLPLSDSLLNALNQYRDCYLQKYTDNDYFFAKKDKGRLRIDSFYKRFRKILFDAGISHGGRKLGPCVHSFRHTFSVHSLAAMSKSGLDLYYSLPVLSKYLGHKSLEATEKYVRLTSDIYPEISNNMNELCSYIFPEVNRT